MAVEKRPAEKATTIRAKKARTSKPVTVDDPSSDPSDQCESQQNGTQSQDLDLEKLSKEFTGRVSNLDKELRARKQWSEQFKERVRTEQAKLDQQVEEAEAALTKKHADFRESLTPALAMLLYDLDLYQEMETDLPFEVKALKTSLAESTACDLLKQCESLLGVYDQLCKQSASTTYLCKARDVFAQDKVEVVKAVEAAKKLTINRLQAQLKHTKDDQCDKFELGEEELRMAQKIVGQGGLDVNRRSSGRAGLGSKLNEFENIVADMQELSSGWDSHDTLI